tara:strand:+ start:122 stop:427 length:306 start_codon:yes stop_codon:yes gene_type:complete
MGLKLGDISPLAGLISGKGMFGDLGHKLGLHYDDTEELKMRDQKAAADKIKGEAASAAPAGAKRGGVIKKKPMKKMAKGGSTASKRADGCATKGKTKGRFV